MRSYRVPSLRWPPSDLRTRPSGSLPGSSRSSVGGAIAKGDVERAFTKDELLTNVLLYWATGTIASSFMPYYDVAHVGATGWMGQQVKQWLGSASVPAAFAMFPKDLSPAARMGRAILQCSALDRNAARRALRGT